MTSIFGTPDAPATKPIDGSTTGPKSKKSIVYNSPEEFKAAVKVGDTIRERAWRNIPPVVGTAIGDYRFLYRDSTGTERVGSCVSHASDWEKV